MTAQVEVSGELLASLLDTAAGIIEPPPSRSIDEWADAERVLPKESPEPGPWRSARVPFTRDVVRAIDDPRYESVVWVTASQTAKTESIFNIIGKRFTDGPLVPTIYVGPTRKQVTSISTDRLSKMIASTPALWQVLAKGQADKTTEKFLSGVRLGFAWAGSATELASHPAGLVLIDERDRMDADVDGEGDPVELARGRIKNYPGGTLGIFSTPTVKGASPVWALYEEGTMMRWAWPCVHCGAFFVPQLKLLTWPEKATPAQARDEACVACPSCGGVLEDRHKHQMNERGKYIPHELDSNGQPYPVEQPRKTATASFWTSGLASPWASFGVLAERMVAAYRSREQERIQTVINVQFGELFELRGESPEIEVVQALRRDYEPRRYPSGVQLITCGADVQKRGIYYTVRGWGFHEKSWLLDHGYLVGDTEYDEVWLQFQRILEQPIYASTQSNAEPLYIKRAFVDSGYKPGTDKARRPDHRVYTFCRRLRGLAYPTKGKDALPKPLMANDIDVTEHGRTFKGGVRLWHIDTDHFKSWLHSHIDPGDDALDPDWLIYSAADDDYCAQMVAEELIVKPSGKRVWILGAGKDNHYFDCEVLARAAAVSLAVHALRDVKNEPGPGEQPAPQNQRPGSFVNRPRGSFFRR